MNEIKNLNEKKIIKFLYKDRDYKQVSSKFKFISEQEATDLLFDLYTRGLAETTGNNNYKAKPHALELAKRYKKKQEENSWINRNGIKLIIYPITAGLIGWSIKYFMDKSTNQHKTPTHKEVEVRDSL